MASFSTRLKRLTRIATERGILDAGTADALVGLAEQQERERGVRSLTAVLGALGGGIVALGVVLLIAANWQGIADGVKIAGFLLLLAGSLAVGFWITAANRPYVRTAAGFHFIGAGLVIAGVMPVA